MTLNGLLLTVALLALPYARAQQSQTQNTSTTIVLPSPPEQKCELITSVPICASMPWNTTFYPDLRGHANQREANDELEEFRQLIELNCSPAIVTLLCAIYTPFCTDNPRFPAKVLRPCRRLCQYVRDDCEPVYDLRTGGLPWPDHLDCEKYDDTDLCFGPPANELDDLTIPPDLLPPGATTTPSPETPRVTPDPNTTNATEEMTDPTMSPSASSDPSDSSVGSSSSPTQINHCPIHMRVTPNIENKSFSFAGIDNCGPNCGGIYFTESQRNIVAPIFILIFALVCIVFTAFTVATFFVNRNRFHYPERPIVYLSLCYLILSIAYFIGAISKLVGGSDSSFACTEHTSQASDQSLRFVFQRLPNDNVNMMTASCVILFLLAYYTQMAASLWWVILTFTWFLAAVLKWGEEAVARLWLLYHVITWSLPALQTILVLALQLVDGDQLSGLCYPGHFSLAALGVFVYMPLLIYLVLGCIFLVIGFTALVNIRRELERDPVKSRKLGRLIIRIGVYATLYIIPNAILLFIHTYELAERKSWEESYIDDKMCRDETNTQCPNSPSFAAFLIRYITIFCVGIFSTSWIFSKKTLNTWTKFFQSCGYRQDSKPFGPNQVYDLPEKDPRRLQTAV